MSSAPMSERPAHSTTLWLVLFVLASSVLTFLGWLVVNADQKLAAGLRANTIESLVRLGIWASLAAIMLYVVIMCGLAVAFGCVSRLRARGGAFWWWSTRVLFFSALASWFALSLVDGGRYSPSSMGKVENNRYFLGDRRGSGFAEVSFERFRDAQRRETAVVPVFLLMACSMLGVAATLRDSEKPDWTKRKARA